MTTQEYQEWNKKALEGTVPDDLNIAFALTGLDNRLLVKIAAGEYDMVALAKHTLDARGLDEKGNWVGFRTR